MGVGQPESSVVSASTNGLHDPSLVSVRTDKSSFSVPEDGRAITIETNHHHRPRKSSNVETSSVLSAASQTSLLIEYFEGARGIGNSPSHRPSVRVKVTPSAQRKLNQQGTREIEVRGMDGRPGNRRTPSYTQRISLSPRVIGDDRLLVANNKERHRRKARSRSVSGEQYSAVSSRNVTGEDGESVSSFSELSSLVQPNPLNVEIIREADSPRNRRLHGIPHDQIVLEEARVQTIRPLRRPRSRSLSNERETILGDDGMKLMRQRSKSMDRERLTKEEIREQRRLNKKMAELNGEKPARRSRSREMRKKEKALKSPREEKKLQNLGYSRSRSRSRGDMRNVSGSSDMSQNPQLLTAVEDAIKRLILPQLEALKTDNRHTSETAIDDAATAAIAAEAARTFVKKSSNRNVRGGEGPLLVLQPDADQGTGHGLILAGDQENSVHRSDSVLSRAPGFGTGPSEHDFHEMELYPVSQAHLIKQAPPGERIRMPSIPKLARRSTDEVRSRNFEDHEIMDHHLETHDDIALSLGARTPPPLATPKPIAPLNISRHNTPSRDIAAAPRSSVSSLRRQYDETPQNEIGDIEILSPQRTGRAGSSLSMNTISTLPDSRLTMNTNNTARRGDISRTIEEDDDDMHHGHHLYQEDAMHEHMHNHDQHRLEDENTELLEEEPEDKEERMHWWFNREAGTYEQRSDYDGQEDQYDEPVNNRHSVADSFEARHLSRVAAGQGVKDVGALASLRSTPVAHSHRASVHEHLSNTSLRSQPPQMGFNALPIYGEHFPEAAHYHSEVGDDIGDEDDMVTNPYGAERNSRQLTEGDDILTNPYGGERGSREIGESSWNYEGERHHDRNSFGLRAMQAGNMINQELLAQDEHDAGIDRAAMVTPLKDEGYMSGVHPISSGLKTESINRDLDNFGAIDDNVSEGLDEEYVPFRGHHRGGSGNSHGMPSPLYDSSLGRGIDRIQSKDIVALMDHLTVRDAQRNARDTEILVTLVRTAAEMRGSFEDLQRQIATHHSQMLIEVDQGTEKTIGRLSGPKLQQPMPLSRQIKARAFEEEKEETTKKSNLFRRAFKGLSGKSSNDLQRIEEMLVTLLNEVESLKQTGYAYSLSNEENSADHSHIHSHQSQETQPHFSQTQIPPIPAPRIQSLPSQESHHSQEYQQPPQFDYMQNFDANRSHEFNYDLNTVTEEPASIRESIRGNNSPYYANVNRAHSNQNLDAQYDREGTPVLEDGQRTPRGIQDLQQESLYSETSPKLTPKLTPPQPQYSNENTPSRSRDKRESGPKVSRWSETTASTGIRSFFGRKKKAGDPDLSRTNSEFEEDWIQPSDQATNSPYTPAMNRFASPSEKPSLEANRRSLEIKHPQPRSKYNHSLEAAAESVPTFVPSSPTMTQSTTSLNRFIQSGGSYNNISGLAPMVPEEKYVAPPAQEYPSIHTSGVYNDPPPALSVASEAPSSVVSSPEKKKKKHRKHKKDSDPDDPERQARRERRRLEKQRQKESLQVPQEGLSDRPISQESARSFAQSPRPGSVNSNRSFEDGDDISVTRQRTSHMTTGI